MRYHGLMGWLLLATSASALAAGPVRPTLVVALAVDQYSADLFTQYRSMYRHGLARLTEGAVFPRGYQSHAGTETCPGHSTILTGAHPARTGIVANEWYEPSRLPAQPGQAMVARYCATEVDSSGAATLSPEALLVPTLGDRLRAADRNSRSVAISGKDRSAIMLGGKNASVTLWMDWKQGFTTYPGVKLDSGLARRIAEVNAVIKRTYATGQQSELPQRCAARSQPIALTPEVSVGELRPTAAKAKRWRATPAFDALTLQMALAAVDELQLGKGQAIDLLAISFAATDYVGHYFGTQGAEMCAQQLALDATLDRLFSHLDRAGISYVVALTADHGGLDIPERNQLHAVPTAQRVDPELSPDRVGAAVAKELNLAGPVLLGNELANDVYLAPSVEGWQRAVVLEAVRRKYQGHPQVARVFTRNELLAAEPPSGPPDEWTLLERAKESFNPQRSGDLVVILQPYLTLYGKPRHPDSDYVASHGSPWDYDRRVPILFWWRGITPFEQPAAVETVDIAPTLADLIGLQVGPHEMDGRVLQLGQR